MPVRFEWHKDHAHIVISGNLSTVDIIDLNGELYGNAKFDQIHYVLWDATDVTAIDLDEGTVNMANSFAAKASPSNPYLKVAFLARLPELRAVIQEYIDSTALRLPYLKQQLFDNMENAKQWCLEKPQ